MGRQILPIEPQLRFQPRTPPPGAIERNRRSRSQGPQGPPTLRGQGRFPVFEQGLRIQGLRIHGGLRRLDRPIGISSIDPQTQQNRPHQRPTRH